MATSSREEEKPPPVSEVVRNLREIEDYNLALSLQEEEFGNHYNLNRTERKIMGVDTKKSKEEQLLEKRFALEKRLAEAQEIAKRDEEVARQVQMEFGRIEEAEARRKAEQDRIDQELAKRLQLTESQPQATNSQELFDDERIARELQERYLRRLNKPNRRLDEEVQNQLNTLVSTNTLPSPSTAGLPAVLTQSQMASSSASLPPLPSYNEALAHRSITPDSIRRMLDGTHLTAEAAPTENQPNIGFLPLQNSTIGFDHEAIAQNIQSLPRVHFANDDTTARESILDYDNRTMAQTLPIPPTTGQNQLQARPGMGLSNSLHNPQASSSMHAPLVTRALSNDLPTPPPEALAGFHPTNPFLQDMLRAQQMNNGQNTIGTNNAQSNGSFHSEFGFPPPSSLASGQSIENPIMANSNVTISGINQKKIPAGGVRMLPPDSNELARRLPRPSFD